MSKDEIAPDIPNIGISKENVRNFFKKYGLLFLILIPVILSIYIRMIPSDIPITDNWAKSTVENYYMSSIKAQLKQQFQNLPDANLESLAQKQYTEYYKSNKATIEQQIKQTSQQYKANFQDENGFTYMPDIDPYTYLRFTENYLETGHVGDEVKDGKEWDNHAVAPLGRSASTSPHILVLAYLHKVMKIFNPKITVMQSTTYFPVIFSALCIIPIFFIGRMFAGNIGGFFAALMMAINGAFLGRTTWGHADTDAYNVLFAVYALWFFFISINEKDFKKSAIYAGLTGLTLGIFSKFWMGWWYVFDFMIGTFILYAIYLIFSNKLFSLNKIKKEQSIMHVAKMFAIFVVSSAIFITIFVDFNTFLYAPIQPIQFTTIKSASHENLWPNVYTTVAELNSASIDYIISSVGGKTFFYLSLLGVLLLFITKHEGKRSYLPYALLIALWYIGIIYASTKGIRFTMMLVPALSLAFGAAVGIIETNTVRIMQKMEFSPKITKTIFIIIVLLLVLPYARGVANSVRGEVPIVNDAWYNVLTKIKTESQPNAIVNSWWDFGHHFKYFADRAVTFDGASQNTPMAHWIGKVLLTDNEKQAIGILKMLDCGSNTAFEILDAHVNDVSESIKILYSIIEMDKTSAKNYLLQKKVNSETADKVLENTHCSPPENYFITSDDMVGKGAVWAHFGSWNFDRADIWIEGKNLPKDEAIARIQRQLGLNEESAKNTYYELKSIVDEAAANNWIAPWPGYAQQVSCNKREEFLICGGIKINAATKDVTISTTEGEIKPTSIAYVENGNFIVKKFSNEEGTSVLLMNQDNNPKIMIASSQLAGSMFTRLFFYDGIGLSHFNKFTEDAQITGGKLIVWKVKW